MQLVRTIKSYLTIKTWKEYAVPALDITDITWSQYSLNIKNRNGWSLTLLNSLTRILQLNLRLRVRNNFTSSSPHLKFGWFRFGSFASTFKAHWGQGFVAPFTVLQDINPFQPLWSNFIIFTWFKIQYDEVSTYGLATLRCIPLFCRVN